MPGQEPVGTGNTISGGIFYAPVLQGGNIQATFHLPAAAPVALAQLPAATAGFTGRDEELAVLAGLLNPARAAGPVLVSAVAVHRNRVGPAEARAFRAVNGLPDALYPPAWAVMQLGTLGAAPAAAGLAWLAGDGELARRLLAGGTGTWALSKLVKQVVRRPRPGSLLTGIRTRGRDAAGLGYLSGHAGVAVALGAAALPRLGPVGRLLTLSAVPAVGLTRVYVGAHLPLDIAGGAALGLAVEAAVRLAQSRAGHSPEALRRRS